MTPIAHAFRLSLAPLVFAAVLAATLWCLAMREPTTIVITMPPSVAPPPAAVIVPVAATWCRGYDARGSSIDLRPWCGW